MKWKLASGIVYALFAIAGFAVIATPLRTSLGALIRPHSYAPGLVWPWFWPLLAAALLAAVADVMRRLMAGGRPGLPRYILLLALVATAFASTRLVRPPARATVRDGLSLALAHVEQAADRAYGDHGTYPERPEELARELPVTVRSLGFFARGGRALSTRVTVVGGASEPVLTPTPDTRPGDVVVALDAARKRYWITAWTLDARRRLRPLTDDAGRAIMAAGASGLPRSRLDPLFPDYPRKLARPPSGAALP
jgi:hypothetical protein